MTIILILSVLATAISLGVVTIYKLNKVEKDFIKKVVENTKVSLKNNVSFAKNVVQELLKNPNIKSKKEIIINVLTAMRYEKK